MTEQEWLASDDPQAMLNHITGKVSERKLRLFAVACCRRLWPLLADERSRQVVEAAEQYADGLITEDELSAARAAARDAAWYAARAAAWAAARDAAWDAARDAAWDAAWYAAEYAARAAARDAARDAAWDAAEEAAGDTRAPERKEQAILLRDICGNPFRPLSSLRRSESWLRWQDGLIRTMAQQMYDSRNFSVMPILADALEDAGCTNEDILSHCRSGSPHVRGCWVVDLILGKE